MFENCNIIIVHLDFFTENKMFQGYFVKLTTFVESEWWFK